VSDATDAVSLAFPPDERYLRLARVSAAAYASLLGLTVEELDDVRIAVDESCAALIGLGDGSDIELTLHRDDERFFVEGNTPLGQGSWEDQDHRLTHQILSVVTAKYSTGCDGDRAWFRLELDHARRPSST
jgi:serine/threonine-protein kinase RsbW